MPTRVRSSQINGASRPVGATTMTSRSFIAHQLGAAPVRKARFTPRLRNPGHDALKIGQGRADPDSFILERQCPDGALVRTTAFLEHGDGLAQLSAGFK